MYIKKKNIYAPGKGIVEGVEEEGVVAMRTSDPAHPRHLDIFSISISKDNKFHRRCRYLRDRNRCGRRGRQVDDPLTVWSAPEKGQENPLKMFLPPG